MNAINKKNNIYLVASVVIVFAVGVYLGVSFGPKIQQALAKDTNTSTEADWAPFWKVWNTIDKRYPGASTVTNEQRVQGAIEGLVASLNDPYTVFFDEEETKQFQEEISGNFEGVGMEVGIKEKVLTVVAPLKDTPAYNAGIKSGDKILKIDDTITSDISIDQAVKLIRGPKGTTVTLSIYREGDEEPREIKIVRDVINVPTLETEKRSDGIFVIRIYSFGATSSKLFREAMIEFANSKSDRLLVDLRGNPGGYLDSAVDMASWFLPSGKPVVIENEGEGKKETIFRSYGYNAFNENLKFVILIDGGSASASEILAGAMQDYDKAILVGEQSYGKGSVQEVVDITPKTTLKVTIAKWLTPLGNSISLKGLTPDYKVEVTKEDIEAKKDPQLDKAVELLNNWDKNN